jgi:hypothetical protein
VTAPSDINTAPLFQEQFHQLQEELSYSGVAMSASASALGKA